MSNSRAGSIFGAIILAAGASTRMGRVKQVLPWKKSTLLQNAIDQVISSKIDDIVVVLGANKGVIEKHTDLSGVDIAINDTWEQGMATSIITGLKHLLSKQPELEAVLIVLSDQPLLEFEFFNKLIYKHIDQKIISSSYSSQLGVPVLFDKRYFKDLLNLKGQQGAKALLKIHKSEVIALEAGEKGVDLDTLEKYNYYYDLYGRQ